MSEQEPFERSWRPVDVTAVLAAGCDPPEPSVGARSDGVGLLYPGRVHSLAAESEGGKTWLALAVCMSELRAGRRVAYVDFEDAAEGVIGRLVAMQATPEDLHGLAYVAPTQPLGAGIHRDDLLALLEGRPSLLVIDGVTEGMALHGFDPLSNKDAAAFGRMLPKLAASAGAAVLLLDHVPKSSENRGRYALGASHKLAGLDGAAYVLENRKPFGVGITGRSTLRVAKDRPGQIRRHALPSTGSMWWLGDLVVESHAETWVEVSVVPPVQREEPFRPSEVMGRVMAAITQHGPLSQRRIRAAVRGRNELISTALDALILEGFLTEKSPHEVLKPWEGTDHE